MDIYLTLSLLLGVGYGNRGGVGPRGVRISIDDGYGFVSKTKFVDRCGSWGRSGSGQVHGDVSKTEFVVSKRLLTQPYSAEGGGEGVSAPISTFENFLDI